MTSPDGKKRESGIIGGSGSGNYASSNGVGAISPASEACACFWSAWTSGAPVSSPTLDRCNHDYAHGAVLAEASYTVG